jgi:multiple sugar transport system permease protein
MLLNSKILARNFFRSLSFLPYISSVVAMAAVWRFFFSTAFGPLNKGMLDMCNWLGGILGNEAMINATLKEMPQWGRDFWPVIIFSVLFTVWKNMGYYMVIFLAGLQGVNRELHEAAAIDGASKWQRFRHITMNQLAPTTSFVMIMVTISSFKAYDIFINLFGGNDGTLSKNTYVIVQQILWTSFRGSLRYGYASAMAMVLLLIVLVVTFFQFRITKNYSAD